MKASKKKLLTVVGLLLATVGLSSCDLAMVNPGELHMIRSANGETAVFTKGRSKTFVSQKRWILDTVPQQIPMKLNVLCGEDDIDMGVDITWTGQFDVGGATTDVAAMQQRIETIIATAKNDQGTGEISLVSYWNRTLESFALDAAKTVLAAVEPADMNNNREAIKGDIEAEIAAVFTEKGFPVKTIGVNLTNLSFPPAITDQRNRIAQVRLKDAENAAQAEADVAAASRLAEVMAEQGEARIVEAEKEALYFDALAARLTPEVLALRRLEAAEKISTDMREAALAAGDNGASTIVITPFGFGDILGSSGEGDLLLRDAIRNNGSGN